MINIKAKKLNSLKDKSVGLILSKVPAPVYFKTRFGIHTFFMKYPIDVLVLNKSNVVIKKIEYLKPNRIFIWTPLYDTVLELPAGFIKDKNINTGSIINLEVF